MPMRHGGRLASRASTCPRDHFHDCTTFIVPHHVKRILADIDTDHGDCRIELVWHGVLLVFGAPFQLPLLAGPEHGRTIPLADIAGLEISQCSAVACAIVWVAAQEGLAPRLDSERFRSGSRTLLAVL